jgi:erythronate-4-phosphate dehydrogenase
MKIIADAAMPYVSEAFSEFGAISLHSGRTITRETVADAEILLVRSITKVTRELVSGTSLKFVATATAGTEHVDCHALQELGIAFSDAAGCNANSVAQYVVAALLHLSKTRGIPLAGRTIGIVGVGNVGSRVRRYAEALGLRCLLNDPPLKRLTGKEIYLPLDEVVEASDILTLHVPLIREGIDTTYNLASADMLKRMKPGAIFFNTCRGKVVDEAAVKAVRSRLGGLVVDVWNGEPSIDPDYLAIADIATPHIAGYSFDGKVLGTALVHRGACDHFRRQPEWSAEPLLTEAAGTIDVSGSTDPVAYAVAKAYDIMADDVRLRPIASLPESERGRFFDGLRASYPKRFEFAHYKVRGSMRPSERKIIETLGFKLATIAS